MVDLALSEPHDFVDFGDTEILPPPNARQSWRRRLLPAPGRETSRALLMTSLLILLLVVEGLLIWLTLSYQNAREHERTERATVELVVELKRILQADQQKIQSINWHERTPAQWRQAAVEALRTPSSVLRIERRDASGRVVDVVDSPFTSPLFREVARERLEGDTLAACEASRVGGAAAYSRSYFVPMGGGDGSEVMDLCIEQKIGGVTRAYTVASISLGRLLAQGIERNSGIEYEASFVESDGTRIARAGLARGGMTFKAERVVPLLQGMSLQLRVDNGRGSARFEVDVIIALVFGLTVAIAAVAFLLVRDRKKRREWYEESRKADERLQESESLAKVGEMASLISHEVNQPLSIIMSYATGSLNVLEGQAATDDLLEVVKSKLRKIAEQADRGSDVVKNVQALVRRRNEEREAIGVDELLAGIMPVVLMHGRNSQSKIHLDIPDPAPVVCCNKVMVEQVLLNLIRNAMQAMESHTPIEKRQVRIRCRTEAGGRIAFSVADRGPGIPANRLQDLFKPFNSSKKHGMGLGLSLCRSVVERHRGTLSFRNLGPDNSQAGTGAEFRFTLPEAIQAATEAAVAGEMTT